MKKLLFCGGLIFIFAFITSTASVIIGYPTYYNWIPSAILGWYSADIYDWYFEKVESDKVKE